MFQEVLILLVIPELPAPSMAFAFAILQTQSRSDIRDLTPLHFNAWRESHWVPAFLAPQSAVIHDRSPRRRDDERSG